MSLDEIRAKPPQARTASEHLALAKIEVDAAIEALSQALGDWEKLKSEHDAVVEPFKEKLAMADRAVKFRQEKLADAMRRAHACTNSGRG